MAKIFISHASDDKDEFVRPLADALKKHHDIWYDEYSLNVGDSLRSKIDEGLRQCDFGVVVLSKSFFDKHWTQNELDALFLLETSHKKIILPIWYKIAKEDVDYHSPMLAGRLASLGNKGVDAVVSELLRAVSASQRTREFSEQKQGKAQLLALTKGISGKEYEEQLFRTVEGVELFKQATTDLMNQIKQDIDEIITSESKPRFSFGRQADADSMTVHGPYRVSLHLVRADYYLNSISDAKLLVRNYERPDAYTSNSRSSIIEEFEYRPRCREGKIFYWHTDQKPNFLSTSQLAQEILVSYSKSIESYKPDESGPT